MHTKWMMGLGATLLLAACGGKSDADVLADAKAQILNECKATASELPNAATMDIGKYCECSGDKVVELLGVEGVRELERVTTPTADHQAKMAEAAASCFSTLLPPG